MHGIGKVAEEVALKFLCKQNLILLEQNFHSRFGEIDIVMQDKLAKTLVFVEVKMRSSTSYGHSQEMLSYRKRQKIIQTANYYLLKNTQYYNYHCRFDVIAFNSKQLDKSNIDWIQNAFIN
jgi:putative endonuclease